MNPEFIEILKCTQKELLLSLPEKLAARGYTDFILSDKFIYAKGDIPVMLIAHMDTVHLHIPKDIYFDHKQQVLWSPQGIGGDDRCGIFSALQITKTLKPYILFTTDEETGCRGAEEAAKQLKDETGFNFLIELDRRGTDDAVFYQCGNEEFQKFICDYGFKLQHGSCSDICRLSPVFDVASANVSIGYRDEHHDIETIHLIDMYQTIEKVKAILQTKVLPHFDYGEIKTNTYYGYRRSGYDYYDDEYFKDWDYDKTTDKVIYIGNHKKEDDKKKSGSSIDTKTKSLFKNKKKKDDKKLLLSYSKEYKDSFESTINKIYLEDLVLSELQTVAILLGVESHTAVLLTYDQLLSHVRYFYTKKEIRKAINTFFID